MKNIHFISAVFIIIFIVSHLYNHFYSIFGIKAHIELMQFLRIGYRNIFINSLLLIGVILQVFTGISLYRKKRRTVNGFWEKLQMNTGLYLAFFFAIHVSAVYSGRYILGLDTNFYFGVAGINIMPFSLFFVPYYALAIIAFFGHIAAVHSLKMKRSILGFSPYHQSGFILGFGVLFTMVVFYGLTNQFQGIEIPEEYFILIGR
jgi:hypothetical protein